MHLVHCALLLFISFRMHFPFDLCFAIVWIPESSGFFLSPLATLPYKSDLTLNLRTVARFFFLFARPVW